MDQVRDPGADGAPGAVGRHLDPVAVLDAELAGRGGVDPQVVLVKQLTEGGIVLVLAVGLVAAAAVEQAEAARRRRFRADVGGQRGNTRLLPLGVDDLDLARVGAELEVAAVVPDGLLGQLDKTLGVEIGHGHAGVLQLVLPDFFDRFIGEVLALAQPPGQFGVDLPAGAGVVERRHALLAAAEAGLEPLLGAQDAGPLEKGGLGQDHVRVPGGLAEVHVHGHDQVELVEDAALRLRVRQGDHRVVAVDEVGLDRVGLAALDGVVGGLQHAGALVPHGVAAAAAVGPLLLDPWHIGAEAAQPLAARVLAALGVEQAAGLFDAAHERVEDVDQARGVEGIAVAGEHPARVDDHPRPVLVQLPAEGLDLGRRNAGLGLGPGGRVRREEGGELGQAGDVAVGEFPVIVAVVDHAVGDAEQQGVVRARPVLPVAGRLGGGDRGARVDVGHPGAVFDALEEALHLLDAQGFGQVAAEQDDVAGVLVVVGKVLAAQAVHRHGGVVNVAAAGAVVVDVVGRTQRLEERLAQVVERAAPVAEHD